MRTVNHDEQMIWEYEAENAVKKVLEVADFDDIRGVISLPADEIEFRYWDEFNDIDELRLRLEEIYDSAWYAYVPFDSGEAVFRGDSWGYVSDLLESSRIEEFFETIAIPKQFQKIMTAADLITDKVGSKLFRIDMIDIYQELMLFLTKHPEYMRNLLPRKFEETVASLFSAKGYDVELTPQTRDGGFDIWAVEKSSIGKALTLIECKRYAESNRVGVDVIRGLYGVVEEKRATKGIIATTSSFTKEAIAFRNKFEYRLALADFDALTQFLREWEMGL